jgi:hypothetical protein
MMKLAKVKDALRSGPYAWPGGYPMFFATCGGEALSFATVRKNWRNVVWDHLNKTDTGWALCGYDINWEEANLYDGHTGERIESAYAEDDATD